MKGLRRMSRAHGRRARGTRAVLVTVVAAAGLALAGCGHPSPTSAAGVDRLGSLEASVDAIAGQVDSDSAG